MIWFLLFLLALTAATGGGAYLFLLSSQKLRNAILAELGLIIKPSGEQTTPFYKWGWRKTSGERVWAERIVRSAFEKARVWLAPEDLAFFERQCRDYSEGKAVHEQKIRERVDAILRRNEQLANHITKIIREVMQYVMAVTKAEAEMLLVDMGVKDRKYPLQQLLKYELRRKLRQAGRKIMGVNSKGLDLEDDSGEFICQLKGFDGWYQWIHIFERECLAQLSRRAFPPYDQVFQDCRRAVQQGLFKDFKTEIAEARHFRDALSQEIDNRQLNVAMDEVERFDSIFYSWKFDDKISFRFTDHKRMRELVMKRDTSPRFREIIIKHIDNDIASLLSLARWFPRHVIFYGRNAKARGFASEQYLKHIERLLLVLPRFKRVDTNPPDLLRIRDRDVKAAREEMESELNVTQSILQSIRQEAPPSIEPEPYLDELIKKEKQRSRQERNLTPDEAEARGWIINIGMDEPNEFELQQLSSPDYRRFYRLNCDGPGDIDYESNSHSAKTQRVNFFNMIIDSLTEVPEIDTTSTAERLAKNGNAEN